jgi:hypothetical protein
MYICIHVHIHVHVNVYFHVHVHVNVYGIVGWFLRIKSQRRVYVFALKISVLELFAIHRKEKYCFGDSKHTETKTSVIQSHVHTGPYTCS